MATYTRTYSSGNDYIAPSQGYSVYVIDGGAGTDTFYADVRSSGFNISPMDSTGVTTVSGASGTTLKLTNVEKIAFKDGKVFTLETLAAGPVTINGTAGNDVLSGTSANNIFDGGTGIDTLSVTNVSSGNAGLAKNGANWSINNAVTGSDTLVNMERIQFSDKAIALDLTGHAGQVAGILACTFGSNAIANAQYVGIGLNLLDNGTSYAQLAELAISVTGKSSHSDIVTLIWSNLMGSAPSAADAAPFINMLDTGMMSVGQLGSSAADFYIQVIGANTIAGLSQTGLEYTL